MRLQYPDDIREAQWRWDRREPPPDLTPEEQDAADRRAWSAYLRGIVEDCQALVDAGHEPAITWDLLVLHAPNEAVAEAAGRLCGVARPTAMFIPRTQWGADPVWAMRCLRHALDQWTPDKLRWFEDAIRWSAPRGDR